MKLAIAIVVAIVVPGGLLILAAHLFNRKPAATDMRTGQHKARSS